MANYGDDVVCMIGNYEQAGGPRFDMSSDFPALGGEGGHGHHIGASHHGLHHSGDPRDFGNRASFSHPLPSSIKWTKSYLLHVRL
jgi:hypothetical protein